MHTLQNPHLKNSEINPNLEDENNKMLKEVTIITDNFFLPIFFTLMSYLGNQMNSNSCKRKEIV